MKRLTWLAASSLLTALFLNTPSAQAEIIFSPMFDASLSVNSASYDPTFATSQTDADGNPVSGKSQSTASNLYLYGSPNLAWTGIPGLWFTPMAEYEFNDTNNILNLDDETFIYDQRLSFYYLLGFNYDLSRMVTAKLKGFGRLERVKESATESLENGLYGYNDAGAWGEVSAAYRLGWAMRTKLGYKGYTRRYPFYTNADLVEEYERTVEPWPADLPRDLHEKDVNVGEAWLRQEMTLGRLPLLANLEVRIKGVQYTEMPAILSDGSFGDTLRRDMYLDVSAEFPFLINPHHQIEVDYAYRLRGSNHAEYDFNLQDDQQYLDGYYNYYQNSVRLLYNFKFAFKLTGYSPQGSLGFDLQRRQYLSRPSRQKQSADDSTGVYVFDKPHWENTLNVAITLRQQLFVQWFNLFASFHFINQNSNTNAEDAATYRYNYTTLTLGAAISY